MAHPIPPPEPVAQFVGTVARRLGTVRAAASLRVSRTTIARLCGRLPVTAGTIALIERAMERSR
jgi:hypothetical protein